MTRLLACLVLGLVLTGCGKSDSEKQAEAIVDAVADAPKCSDVWVVGNDVPDDYEGCKGSNGDLSPAMSYDCVDGSTMFIYGDAPNQSWTVAGKVVAGSDDDYSEAFFGKGGCKPS